MKTFKQFILEFKRVDIPYDGRTAPTRYNNPGGAYPKSGLERFGMEGYGIIGGGHKIAKYPTPSQGVAANIAHLRSMPITGKTVGQARHYWVNGNFGGTMALPGLDPSQVITPELLKDQNWLARWMISTAQQEGYKGTLDKEVFDKAFQLLDGASNYDPSKLPEYKGTQPTGGQPGEQPQNMPPEGQQEAEPEEYGTIKGALAGLAKGLMELGGYGKKL